MLIEPVGELDDVQRHGQPAVGAARVDDQLDGASEFAGPGSETLGLIERHERVGVPVINQRGRKIRCEVTST